MNKWLKGATALILALSFNVGADVANGQVEFSPTLDPAPAPARPTTRPTTISHRAQSAKSPSSEAERFWREVVARDFERESETRRGKRYLVCFIQTAQYDYQNGREVPEELQENIVDSYCVSALALNMCGCDETITVSGKYLNKKNIDAVFSLLAKNTEENDEIFVYWNGHGGQAFGNGAPLDLGKEDERDGVDEYLSLYETFKPCETLEEVEQKIMLDDALAANFKKLDGRRVMAFFEVCHAAGLANPEQVVVTARRSSGARPLRPAYSNEPKLPCVASWEELLNSEFNSTAQWLSMERAARAFAFERKRNLNDNDPAAPADDEEENVSTDEDEDYNDDPADMFRDLDEQARGSKGAKRAKAEEIGPSLDLSRDTCESLAVAFTSLENELSSAGVWCVQDGWIGRRPVNPGAYALLLAICKARENNVKLSFADFRVVLDAAIVAHNNLELEINRRYPDVNVRDSLQTPAYIANEKGNDTLIYDPEYAASREN